MLVAPALIRVLSLVAFMFITAMQHNGSNELINCAGIVRLFFGPTLQR